MSGSALVSLQPTVTVVPNVTCTGVLTTDILEIYPTSPTTFPTGYAVHHALPTAAGRISAVLSLPSVGVATAYSIPVAVYSVNR